jgi:membrane protein implicated in regulation of membrane protease activity
MKLDRGLGWVIGIVAGVVAVVCCAIGPAVVAGSLLAAGAALVTGSGLIALLAFAFLASVVAVSVVRRSRWRTRSAAPSDETRGVAVPASEARADDRPRGTVGS